MRPDTVLTLLSLFGALQGLLLAFAVGSLSGGLRRSNRTLAMIFLGASTVMVVILVSHRGGRPPIELALVEYVLWAMSGPIAYLYVSLVCRNDRWPGRRFALHFVPAALLLGVVLFWWASGGAAAWQRGPWLPPVLLMMLYQMTYTGLALRRWLGAGRDPAARSSLGLHAFWVPALLVTLAIQHLAQWVRYVFRTEEALRDVVPVTGAASFVVLAFLGLRRALPALQRQQRYASSSLTEERARDVAERLAAVMEEGKPYLRPDLTLEGLAVEVGVSKTHLSQVINERVGRSFPELVAGYRIRESERLLLDESLAHLTVEAVARRSGFQSRSAFYETFRRVNGMTPTEFRRQAGRRG